MNKYLKKAILPTLLLSILLVITILVANRVPKETLPSIEQVEEQIAAISAELNAGEILSDKLTAISPNRKYIAYVTTSDMGFKDAKLWVRDVKKKKSTLIAPDAVVTDEIIYTFFNGLAWNPDGNKLAYLSMWPTEIVVVDVENIYSKEILITKVEEQDNNLLNPSIGYQGKTLFYWTEENTIIFENNKSLPESIYSINYETKKISPINSEYSSDVPGINIRITQSFYSQSDPEWKSIQLGNCPDENIETGGCAITAVAMILKSLDSNISPKTLNILLSENHFQGYLNDCEVKWYVVPNFVPQLIFKNIYSDSNMRERIDYELGQGNYIIAGFDSITATNGPHWVVINGKTSNGKYTINDPGDLTYTTKLLDIYGPIPDHVVVYEIASKD